MGKKKCAKKAAGKSAKRPEKKVTAKKIPTPMAKHKAATDDSPGVMAIISQKMFLTDCKTVEGMLPEPGDIVPLQQYVSTNKNLQPLSQGGDLYLVTVRPGEELWLVAVLRAPKFSKDRWHAGRNEAPIVNIDSLKNQFRFTSGTGITAKEGALGMSLQTPRTLTREDVELLEAALRVRPEQQLIEQLQQRNANRATATDGRIHPQKAAPRVSKKHLQSVEKALGFDLPELVRALYLNVGNGGFGPEYGIVGTKGGVKLDGHTLETCYHYMLQLENENPIWRWPKHLLPLANYGCGMWSCIDCTQERLPMFLWDPNNLDTGDTVAEERRNWYHSFWDLGVTMKTWLSNWLAEKDQPEPVPPGSAWIKKRLKS
ncbi:MAG: SMI1/KNR4 family protein [Pirellulales bacterium]|nr:SMI1/KNR4 family protein [Pirellulales bacterium]